MAERLGEILIKKKLVNEEQLAAALKEQQYSGRFLGEILIQLGYVNEDDFLKVLAEQFNTRFISLDQVNVNPSVLKIIPKDLVWQYKFLPIDMRSGIILIAVSNPLDIWPLSVLQEKFHLTEVQTVLAKKEDILNTIKKYYGTEGG